MTALLITYLIHSSVLLCVAYAVDRLAPRQLALREVTWKVAVVLPFLSATIPTIDLVVKPTWGEARVGSSYQLRQLASPDTPPAGSVERREFRGRVDRACLDEAMGRADQTRDDLRPFEQCQVQAGGIPSALLLLLALTSVAMAGRHLYHTAMLGRLVRDGTALRFGESLPPGIRLLRVDALPGPIAIGRRTIALPGRCIEQMTPIQLRAVLAHELSHLRRRDPLWTWALRSIEGAFYFQPLYRLARRQFEAIAELRADDDARRRTGGMALAESIAVVSSWQVSGTRLAPGLARRPGLLRERVSRLLAPPDLPDLPDFHLRTTALLLLVLLAFALPRMRGPADVAEVQVVVEMLNHGTGPNP